MIDVDRYQFTTENWEFIHTFNVEAVTVNNRRQPIPIQESNLIFTNKLLLIYISHGGMQTTWNWGGRVQQAIGMGLIVGNPINTFVKEKSLVAQQWNLFIPNSTVNDYSLRFIVPRWFTEWECTIFGYTGIITNDLEDNLSEIKSDIATLQSDFDAHFGI